MGVDNLSLPPGFDSRTVQPTAVVTILSTFVCVYEMKQKDMLLQNILSNLHCFHYCPSIF